jgi:hypothetical protein
MSFIKLFDQQIDQSEADYFINLFKNGNKFLRDQGREILCNPEDEVSKNFIRKYSEIVLKYHLSNGDLDHVPYITDFLIIKSGPGSFCMPHTDQSPTRGKDVFTIMFYLNDDFDGGILQFPENDYSYDPKPLTFISFDAMLLHQVTMVTKGVRYALSIGFTDDEEVDKYPMEKMEIV